MNDLVNVPIGHLSVGIPNITVSGVVISKYEKRNVISTKLMAKSLSVFKMVVRDSARDFILVTVWGSEMFIDELIHTIPINSAVMIREPLVKVKGHGSNESSNDEIFRPVTSSHFELVVSETPILSSKIVVIKMTEQLRELISLPITEENDFYTLEDLSHQRTQYNSGNTHQEVNLLFSIREMGQVQHITCKSGKKASKLDLIIFDSTVNEFKLTIWDAELIKFALEWKPKENVIFGVNLRLHENDYSKSLEVSSSSRTIFIINPVTKEGFTMYNYARNARLPEIIPVMQKIKSNANRCTVVDLKKRLANGELCEFALVEGMITEFDIDEDPGRVFIFKCKRCNLSLNVNTKKCFNQNCLGQNHGYIKLLDKSIKITDDTSTLINVRIGSNIFEKMIGYQIENFIGIDEEARSKIKWSILFERKTFLIKVSCYDNEANSQPFMKFSFKIIDYEE